MANDETKDGAGAPSEDPVEEDRDTLSKDEIVDLVKSTVAQLLDADVEDAPGADVGAGADGADGPGGVTRDEMAEEVGRQVKAAMRHVKPKDTPPKPTTKEIAKEPPAKETEPADPKARNWREKLWAG